MLQREKFRRSKRTPKYSKIFPNQAYSDYFFQCIFVWDFYHLYSSGVPLSEDILPALPSSSLLRFTLHNLREHEGEVDKKIFVQRQEMMGGCFSLPASASLPLLFISSSWGWFFISLEKSLTLNEQLTCRWELRGKSKSWSAKEGEKKHWDF